MTDIQEIKDLRKMVLLREMSDNELKIISSMAKRNTYNEDDLICSHGYKRGGMLHFINKGAVEITLPLNRFDSKKEVVSILKEGECFGELSFFDEHAHSANVTALNNVELLEISHEDYEQFVKNDLELGYKILRKLVQMIINIVRDMDARYSQRPFVE